MAIIIIANSCRHRERVRLWFRGMQEEVVGTLWQARLFSGVPFSAVLYDFDTGGQQQVGYQHPFAGHK
jgi:hypothetical protein